MESSSTIEMDRPVGTEPLGGLFFTELDSGESGFESPGADISELGPPTSEIAPSSVKRPVLAIELPPEPRYRPEKAWLGTVTALIKDGFEARLQDLANGPDLEADFSFDEVSAMDRDLVEVGSEFYWNLGYRDDLNGQRERYALLRFRRIPPVTESQLKESRKRAQSLLNEL